MPYEVPARRLLSSLSLLALLLTSTRVDAQDLRWVIDFGDNPGSLNMAYYTPPNLPPGPRPVVVALHGCTMAARDYAAIGWREAADEFGFHVIFPEQRGTNNLYNCFNWWTPSYLEDLVDSQIGRMGREPRSIVQMVRHFATRANVDTQRVFVTGLSAGAGMTAVLLAAYPDVFSAGQIVAGVPFGCARTPSEALSCMEGIDGTAHERTAAQWAALVAEVAPPGSAPPRTSIWHGEMDSVVRVDNSQAAELQWTTVHGVASPWRFDNEVDHVSVWGDAQGLPRAGRSIVEVWRLPALTHAVPVLPPSCGATGDYRQDVGRCSVRFATSFFALDDRTPPTAELRVQGNRLLTTARSSDAIPLAAIRVRIDGTEHLGGEPIVLSGAEREAELWVADGLNLWATARLTLHANAGDAGVDAAADAATDSAVDANADGDVPADGAVALPAAGCACGATSLQNSWWVFAFLGLLLQRRECRK